MTENRYRIAPRVAWTNEERELGDDVQELLSDRAQVVVAAVALPDGNPLVFLDTRAILWELMVDTGEDGITAFEATSHWCEGEEPSESMLQQAEDCFREWVDLGMATRIDGPNPPARVIP